MRRITFLFMVTGLLLSLHLSAQNKTEGIKWMSITEAEKLSTQHPKKILIDIYTDWCGWCKKLDATTYKDPSVVAYDPAQRINGVAANFMSSSSGYPTTTFLDEKFNVISVVPGYMQTDMMNNVLSYINGNHYLNTDWNTYLSSLNPAPK